MEVWQIILIGVGAITLLAGAISAVILTIRTKSDEGWRQIAERRKADLEDVRLRYAEEKKCRKEAEHERDDFTQRYLRAHAKVEWFESHGAEPPDSHTSRG